MTPRAQSYISAFSHTRIGTGKPSFGRFSTWPGIIFARARRSAYFYEAADWMVYLIDTFLKPGAVLQHDLANRVPGWVYPPN